MELLHCRRHVNTLLADRRLAAANVKQEKAALAEATQEAADLEQARAVLQAVAEVVQRQAHRRIAGVVSKLLSAVFGEEAYSFKVEFRKLRGKTEANLLLVRDGLEIDPLDAAGGGVVDVVSMGLRLACLTMARPPLRRLLILDEPFRFLSKDYRSACRAMLEAASRELGVQIILVSHSPDFMIGKVIQLGGEE